MCSKKSVVSITALLPEQMWRALNSCPKQTLSMYVRSHIYSKSMDQPGKVVNPARGQLNNKEN